MDHKTLMTVMRLLTGLILSVTAYLSHQQGQLGWDGFVVLLAYLASVATTLFEKLDILKLPRIMTWLFLFDTVVVSLFFYLVGTTQQEFYIVYFLTILIAAGIRNARSAFLAALISSGIYTWLTMQGKTGIELLSVSFNIRITLFYVYALFVGTLAEESSGHRRMVDALKQQYGTILDQVRIGIMVLDPSWTIVNVNSPARDILGLRDGIAGRPLKNVVDYKTFSVLVSLLNRLASVPIGTAEMEIEREGEARVVEVTATPLLLAGNRMIQLIAHDKTATAKLKRIQDDADRFEIVSQFTASVAHGVNNPLAAVMGLADLTRRRTADAQAKEACDRIYLEVSKAAQILHGFLKMLGHHQMDKQSVDVNRLCRNICELWKDELLSDDFSVSLSFQPSLPPLRVDREKLAEVLMVLIHSIRQSMSRGDEERTLLIQTRSESDSIRITLRNALHEPAPDQLVSMKVMHSQKIGQSADIPATLKMCESVIVDHGGDILLSRDADKPCFVIHLPFHPEAAVPQHKPEAPAAAAPAASKRILIVEDEPAIQEILSDYLASLNHTVDRARNGEAARQMLEKRTYDAIISDIKMPRFSGIDLYYHVQKTYPGMAAKIIFISGDTMSPDTMAFLKSCPNERIDKPFGMDRITAALNKVLK